MSLAGIPIGHRMLQYRRQNDASLALVWPQADAQGNGPGGPKLAWHRLAKGPAGKQRGKITVTYMGLSFFSL
jgi:hypothetical protein